MLEMWHQFARLVRKHRQESGLSQDALAEASGVHRTHISLIEREMRCPSLAVASRIAAALGVTLSELIAEAESLTRTASKVGGAVR